MMEEEVEESDSDDEIKKNLARKRNPQPVSGSPDVWKDDSGILNLSYPGYPGPCLPHPQVSVWSRHDMLTLMTQQEHSLIKQQNHQLLPRFPALQARTGSWGAPEVQAI